MSTTAMVNLWGRTIGAVSLDDNSATATFEYDSAVTSSGIEVAPLMMPLSGRMPESFNAVERLCYTGSRGMGSLEYEPATRFDAPGSSRIEVDKLVALASEVLNHRDNLQGWFHEEEKQIALRDIVQVGTSAGGARAKAVIAWNLNTNEIRSGQVKTGGAIS